MRGPWKQEPQLGTEHVLHVPHDDGSQYPVVHEGEQELHVPHELWPQLNPQRGIK